MLIRGRRIRNLARYVDVMLEVFGECELLVEVAGSLMSVAIRKLNWTVLPPGRHPWGEMKRLLEPVVRELPDTKQIVANDRLAFINDRGPDFAAVGEAGFKGYIVFGFEETETYILESLQYGNAVYVLGQDW